jgi:hypothetical protein
LLLATLATLSAAATMAAALLLVPFITALMAS